ncbi:MAG TPA: hypothetical protein VKA45_15090, partial [Gaiellaceae bacterium]|nr:hypothetical protein [Gaiellaceae bacterium]
LALAGAAPASVDTPADVRTLVAEIERMHPNPYHYLAGRVPRGGRRVRCEGTGGELNKPVQAA